MIEKISRKAQFEKGKIFFLGKHVYVMGKVIRCFESKSNSKIKTF